MRNFGLLLRAGAGFVFAWRGGFWCLAADWGPLAGWSHVLSIFWEQKGLEVHIFQSEILLVGQRVWGHMPSLGSRKLLGSPGVVLLLRKKHRVSKVEGCFMLSEFVSFLSS